MVAIFLMFTILVTQFNSLYQAVLVLSAIVLSTAGVLMGLLLNAPAVRYRHGGDGDNCPGRHCGQQQHCSYRYL